MMVLLTLSEFLQTRRTEKSNTRIIHNIKSCEFGYKTAPPREANAENCNIGLKFVLYLITFK